MDSPLVSIIIVNWNGRDYLKACLSSLQKIDYKNFEMIIVDNNSSDGSAEYVRKKYPHARLIINSKNVGFAEGNNIGYKKARGEYILFLNNDTVVTRPFLSELIYTTKRNKAIGGAQSKILLMDDRSRLDSVGSFLTHSGFLYHYGANKKDGSKYNRQINLYSAKGACMIFKRTVLERVLVNNEIFDSDYFAYFEETDLCHRVWLAGYRIVFVPISVIYHKMGGTNKKLNNSFIQYHSYKNRINSYLKNLSLSYLIRILPVHIFLNEVYALIALFQLRMNLFLSIQRAILWNITHIRDTFKKREIIQRKIRNISDDRLMPIIMKKVKFSYYIDLPRGLKEYKDEPIEEILRH